VDDRIETLVVEVGASLTGKSVTDGPFLDSSGKAVSGAKSVGAKSETDGTFPDF
jgi:hypothetical protein